MNEEILKGIRNRMNESKLMETLTGYINNDLLDEEFLYREVIKSQQENTNLKQALNEIRKVINECKMLMPHEFDWEEQADNILQIIDKVGGNE